MDVTYHLWFDLNDRVWDLRTSQPAWAIYSYTRAPVEPIFKYLPTRLRTIDGKGPNIWT